MICKEVEYLPAKEDVVQSCTKQDPGFIRNLKKEGYTVFVDRGWAYISRPARLVVTLKDAEDNELTFNIITFFRANWGRLSQKRQAAIQSSKPKTVEITEENTISQKSLMIWLEQAQVIHKTKKPKTKRKKVNNAA